MWESLKKKRKNFSQSQKIEIITEQDNRCADCRKKFNKTKKPVFDHINGKSEDNRIENGQALCADCHDLKSREENTQRNNKKDNSNDPFDMGNFRFDSKGFDNVGF
ncbi:MAG: HNH endonuclease [Nitrosopumilus sp. (ex Thoosa mismalolli)]|nr:HNH endonuclease [Nitrosopumilus sp. (ex Thoosa mismalolli)]